MASPDPALVQQVASEYQEILNAPPIHYGPTVPRCHFCGAISREEDLQLVETLPSENGAVYQRFRGGCCGNAG